MANYTVDAQLVSGSQTPTTVITFNPAPLLTNTQPGFVSSYYTQGQVVSDTDLGGAGAVTKHQGKKAIH